MQQPIADEERLIKTIPVPSRLRRRLWYMVISSGLFLIIAYVEGALRPNYDAWQQSISALSLGSHGWIQMLNFLALGAIVLSTVTTWHKILAGRRGALAIPMLTSITGVSLIFCGIFPQDPAPGYDPEGLSLTAPTLHGLMHLSFAGVIALSSVASLLIMARHFATDPLWYRWRVYSVLMAAAMTAFVTIYAIWSTHSTGYAGTFERLGLMVAPVWCMTFLIRLESETPFMRQ